MEEADPLSRKSCRIYDKFNAWGGWYSVDSQEVLGSNCGSFPGDPKMCGFVVFCSPSRQVPQDSNSIRLRLFLQIFISSVVIRLPSYHRRLCGLDTGINIQRKKKNLICVSPRRWQNGGRWSVTKNMNSCTQCSRNVLKSSSETRSRALVTRKIWSSMFWRPSTPQVSWQTECDCQNSKSGDGC